MKMRTIVRKPGFTALAFLLALGLYVWPFFMTDNIMKSPGFIYPYLFAAWSVSIAVLFVLSRGCGDDPSQ